MTHVDAYHSAIGYLSRREHARQELVTKLEKKGFEGADIDSALSQLKEEGYQSDARYAESMVRYRAMRGKGPVSIRDELSQKGVSSLEIDMAFEAFEGDWFEHALRVRSQKFGEARAPDFKALLKEKKFLQYRGFTMEQIKEVCG